MTYIDDCEVNPSKIYGIDIQLFSVCFRRHRRSSPRDRPASFPGPDSDAPQGRPRSSSSPLKLTKENAVANQSEEAEEKTAQVLEGSLSSDITSMKTMLLKLRRLLQEVRNT